MLLYGCVPKKSTREVHIIAVDMDKLLILCREENESLAGENSELPASVYFQTKRGTRFVGSFDDTGGPVPNNISKELATHLESTSQGFLLAPVWFSLRPGHLGRQLEMRV